MLDGTKLADASSKLININKDLSWIDYNNSSELCPTFNVMAVKSLILQLKEVERLLAEVVEETEVQNESNQVDK